MKVDFVSYITRAEILLVNPVFWFNVVLVCLFILAASSLLRRSAR